MRLISRHVDYAVNALCFMVKRDSFARVSDLRKELDMPPFFIREIMRLLGKAGVLRSTRGKMGGFALAIPPAKINVYMLMAILNDVDADNNCTFRKRNCPRSGNCKLREKLLATEALMRKRMKGITIASLIEDC